MAHARAPTVARGGTRTHEKTRTPHVCLPAHAHPPSLSPPHQIGFSIGARLIFHCLLELSRCGARGIVESAVLLGAPVSGSVSAPRWAAVRSVVSGRFVNAYSANDWVLGIVFRCAAGSGACGACVRGWGCV